MTPVAMPRRDAARLALVDAPHPLQPGLGRRAEAGIVGRAAGDDEVGPLRGVLEQVEPGEVLPDRVLSSPKSSSIGTNTSESMSPATSTRRSSTTRAACPGECAGCSTTRSVGTAHGIVVLPAGRPVTSP